MAVLVNTPSLINQGIKARSATFKLSASSKPRSLLRSLPPPGLACCRWTRDFSVGGLAGAVAWPRCLLGFSFGDVVSLWRETIMRVLPRFRLTDLKQVSCVTL